jgi:hypothetical protein
MTVNTLPAPHGSPLLPKTYRRMQEDGVLDWTTPRGIQFSPVQWLSQEKILQYAVEETTPVLLPFASTPGNDFWCWYRGWEINGAMPVVFASHYTDDVMGYAPDFAGCLYRMLLEEMTASRLVGEMVATPKELPDLFQRYTENIAPYLPREWGYMLQSLNISHRPVIHAGENMYGILYPEETERIIAHDLSFSGLNQEVRIATGF